MRRQKIPSNSSIADSQVIRLVGKNLLKPLDIRSYGRVSSDASHSFRGLKGVVMQLALRPYATAGVALVGASVIAVSPVTVTPTAVQEVRDDAVYLAASVDPIAVFRELIQTTV